MYQSFFKPLIDFCGALLMLPFVLLVVIIFGPIIYFTDRGPVFYNALRAGKDYKPFKMFKLRSMYVNSPDLKNPDGSTFNSDNDPRVTPVGRFLRKTSLDEFPQFLNILLGDMSFVGPRPKTYSSKAPNGCRLEELDETHQKSYSVRPGVTGYAQAFFRNSITNEEKFKWDAYYVDRVSFWLDIKILWKTAVSVLARQNINTVKIREK